jgi:hypothetical protein
MSAIELVVGFIGLDIRCVCVVIHYDVLVIIYHGIAIVCYGLIIDYYAVIIN